jgi:hypothetical protein
MAKFDKNFRFPFGGVAIPTPRRGAQKYKVCAISWVHGELKGCFDVQSGRLADMTDAAALARNGNPTLPAWTMTANGESTTDDRPAILGRGLMRCHS